MSDAAPRLERVPLSTARLTLDPASEAAAEDFVSIACDPELAAAAGRAWSPSRDDALARFAHHLERQARGELAVWALRVDGGLFAGAISLRAVDRAPHAWSLGYEMMRGHWGKGLMTEAAQAVVAHAFACGFHRVEATTGPNNVRSQRVLERTGFRLEGRLRDAHCFEGRFEDSLVYGRLRTD